MFGWCKSRKDFVSRLIGKQSYQFKENEICEFHDLGDFYSVYSGSYSVEFAKESFYKKFKVIERNAEYFEDDCIIDIYTYKKINSAKENSYLAFSLYLGEYYEWLNNLYDFKKDTAFQELIDFEDYERVITSETSKKIYGDLKKYYDEAMLFNKKLEEKDPFTRLYKSMMEAFKFASDDGKVKFV